MASRLRAFAVVIPVLMLAAVALAPTATQAQTPAPQRPPGNATLTGEVQDVNPLTVRVDGQDRLLQTAPNIVVNRDGKEVKLGDLEEGDTIAFTTNPDNSVARIDVTAMADDDSSRWLLVGLLVLLAIAAALAVWYFTQRRRGHQVRHTTDAPIS